MPLVKLVGLLLLFTYSFIRSFSIYALNTYYVSRVVVSAEYTAMNKTNIPL